MCGRIEFHVESIEKLDGRYGLVKIKHGWTEQGFFYPRFNVPPTAHMPLLTSDQPDELVIGHWGYLPHWAEGKKMHAVINARAETVYEKPYFKSAIKQHRCLIPVTGFFEWHRTEKKKTPYRFHRDGEIFSIGGLYSVIKDEKGGEMPHWAIITTEANSLMEPVHDRIPVIIEEKNERAWIDEGLPDEEVQELFKPVRSDYLKKYEISSLVNSPKNDSPEILAPVKH